jgi:hypothetical protein
MKQLTITILLLLSLCPVLSAQVYVLTRTDRGGIIIKSNLKDGLCKAYAESKNQGGTWKPLLITSAPGHGSIFAILDTKKIDLPRHYISYGKNTSKEAVNESRQKAYDDVPKNSNGRFQVSWSGVFNNQNKFPLGPPPSSMAEIEAQCK